MSPVTRQSLIDLLGSAGAMAFTYYAVSLAIQTKTPLPPRASPVPPETPPSPTLDARLGAHAAATTAVLEHGIALADGAPSTSPPPAPPVHVTTHVTGALRVATGKRYRVVVVTKGSVSAGASASAVKSKAESEGFQDVVVKTDMPPGWPGSVRGEYYVDGIYNRNPRTFERKTNVFLGSVSIIDAWEG